MSLLKKEVCIECTKTKEEVIALLSKNIEPFHKDGSKIPFEGKISQEGIFSIRLSREFSGYNRGTEGLKINGSVNENVEGSTVKIVFTVTAGVLYLICFIIPVILLITVLSYLSIIDLKMPWYLLLGALTFFILFFMITFYNDRTTALKFLKKIVN